MSADRDRRPEPSDATSPAQLGGYRVIRLLGAGGMGQVYLAHDDVLDRPVAIKRLRPDGATRPDRRARFRREARLAARLNHPAVVQLYGVLDGDDGDGLVMEFVAGASLRAYADGRALPIDEVLDIGLQLADGLGYAHDQGIVHRDLKGENVLRTPDGRLKIADFGIAKALAGDAATRSDQTSLTRGNVLGTYRAMAPEQARGDAIDHRADLFAFGVLLYELLAGHNPFLADNDLATLRRVIEAAHAPLRDHRPDVPDGLAALVDHLLQKDPRLRPRHAAEVAEALRQLRGLPAPAPPSALTRPPAAALRAGAVTSATFAPVATHEAPATVDDASQIAAPATHDVGDPARPTATTSDASRGRRRAALVAGIALALAGVAFAFWLALRPAPLDARTVAVLPPTLQAEDGAQDADGGTPWPALLPSAVRLAAVQALIDLPALAPREVDPRDASDGTVDEAVRATAADEVVTARLRCRPGRCAIALRRHDADSGDALWAEDIQVPTDDLALVARSLRQALGRAWPDRPLPGDRDSGLDAAQLRDYLTLRARFEQREDGDPAAFERDLAALLGRAPDAFDVRLLAARHALRRFHLSHDAAQLEAVDRHLDRAAQRMPDSGSVRALRVQRALAAEDRAGAAAQLDDALARNPADPQLLRLRAELAAADGRADDALATLREVVALHPSWKHLWLLARTAHEAGETDAARAALDRLLARRADSRDARSLRAQIELTQGDVERAIDDYESLTRDDPSPVQLGNLAVAYLLATRYDDAVATAERIRVLVPDNAFVLLNLADAYDLAGRRADAARTYRDVIARLEGAESVQALTVRAQAWAHLGDAQPAVAAVQQALQRAPTSAQVAYEAALVYTLVGDLTSASVQAERALDEGYGARWFDFPWFAPLRAAHPSRF